MLTTYKEILTPRVNIAHVVSCNTDCTIYNPDGSVALTVKAGAQETLVPLYPSVFCDCDSVIIRPVFNLASLGASSSGGESDSSITIERYMPYQLGDLPDTLSTGYIYDLGEISELLNLNDLELELVEDGISFAELWFTTAVDVAAVIWPVNAVWAEGSVPVLSAASDYRFAIRLVDGNLHICHSPYFHTTVLPNGMRLEYIESEGTQYIDTGVSLNESIQCLKVEWVPLAIPDSGYGCVMGAIDSSSSSTAKLFIYITSGGLHSFNLFSTYVSLTDTGVSGNVVINSSYTFSSDGNHYFVNGGEGSTIFSAEGSGEHSIYLFALNCYGSSINYSKLKIYSFEYKDEEQHVHLIPFQLTTGEVGMLDVISGTFHANQGSGDFIAGPVI